MKEVRKIMHWKVKDVFREIGVLSTHGMEVFSYRYVQQSVSSLMDILCALLLDST